MSTEPSPDTRSGWFSHPVSADFTVSAKSATPATGDPLPAVSVVLIVVALVALGAAIAAFIARRRTQG